MRTKSQQGCDGSRKTEVDVGLPFTLMKDGDDDNSTGGEGSKWRFFWQREEPSTGFPLADLGPSCDEPSLRYPRVMYSAGHGLAPWCPMSPNSVSAWSRSGVVIGDVGYLDTTYGSFQHLFNIFFDKKSPDDSVVKMPDNFTPIEPPFAEWDVHAVNDHFPPGTVITSEGVEATLSSDAKFSVKEGGILVLPKGGSRQDLVDKEKLYDYISSQALEWFQFKHGYGKNRRSIKIPNGNLYLVTGVDKVPEWSVFSFWRNQDGKINERLSGRYVYGDSNPWSVSDSHVFTTWDNHCPEADHDGQLATAFIRGLRIGLSPTAWEEFLPTKISDSIYNIPTGALASTTTVTSDSFVRSLRKAHPEISQEVVFHPCFIIIQMILAKTPKKNWPRLVVVDDALWCPFAQGKYLNWNVTVDLVAHIFKMNKIVLREGIMYLAPKGAEGTVGQAESVFQRLMSYLIEDFQHRSEVYLTSRAIKKAVKLIVFEKKEDDE